MGFVKLRYMFIFPKNHNFAQFGIDQLRYHFWTFRGCAFLNLGQQQVRTAVAPGSPGDSDRDWTTIRPGDLIHRQHLMLVLVHQIQFT